MHVWCFLVSGQPDTKYICRLAIFVYVEYQTGLPSLMSEFVIYLFPVWFYWLFVFVMITL